MSLPEVPLLGVLPGTGGLTRVVDKRHVRKDRADLFATKSEGYRGSTAVEWGLVDATVPRSTASRTRSRARASEPRRGSEPPAGDRRRRPDPAGPHRRRRHASPTRTSPPRIDRAARRVDITVRGPDDAPAGRRRRRPRRRASTTGRSRVTRALDDLVLRLRTNEPELGTWVLRTAGDARPASSPTTRSSRDLADDWFVNEVRHYYKRTLKRLDVTSRSLFAVIEPGSCFAGLLLELALAADRQYMLEGVYEDVDPDAEPATIVLDRGQRRRRSRWATACPGCSPGSGATTTTWPPPARGVGEPPRRRAPPTELGLVTLALDDIDFEDELRIVLEERASLSPDALTGMEANHRFVGPETMETKIFGRLTAWQNWIFIRPNASGPDGALRRYGTGPARRLRPQAGVRHAIGGRVQRRRRTSSTGTSARAAATASRSAAPRR